MWSLGPSLAGTLFDDGKLQAQERQVIAAYDQSVASYRQTVLTSFQQVEDNLVGVRLLATEATAQARATVAADAALATVQNQYQAGTVNYLSVISAQSTALSNRRTLLALQSRQYVSTVALMMALGGGW